MNRSLCFEHRTGLRPSWFASGQHHLKVGTSGHDLAKAISKHTEAMEVADAMESWQIRKQAD